MLFQLKPRDPNNIAAGDVIIPFDYEGSSMLAPSHNTIFNLTEIDPYKSFGNLQTWYFTNGFGKFIMLGENACRYLSAIEENIYQRIKMRVNCENNQYYIWKVDYMVGFYRMDNGEIYRAFR